VIPGRARKCCLPRGPSFLAYTIIKQCSALSLSLSLLFSDCIRGPLLCCVIMCTLSSCTMHGTFNVLVRSLLTIFLHLCFLVRSPSPLRSSSSLNVSFLPNPLALFVALSCKQKPRPPPSHSMALKSYVYCNHPVASRV
jgi:hypothetical protein